MKTLFAFLVMLCAVCFVNALVEAQVVLNPVKDQFVQQSISTPFTTTSADSLIRVRASATGSLTVRRNGYVRYDIANVKGTLTKAELALTVQQAANNAVPVVPDRADVYQVGDSWDPATLIFDNQPAAGPFVVSLENVARVAAADFPKPVYKVDVTGYVQSKLTASASVISFMLTDSLKTGADLRFYSSRCATSAGQRPIQLILTGVTATGVEDADIHAPSSFAVNQNYPNPFNPSTIVTYSLPSKGYVDVSVYNVLGEKIASLFSGEQAAGLHQLGWNGRNQFEKAVSSGVYFTRVTFGGSAKSIIMQLHK